METHPIRQIIFGERGYAKELVQSLTSKGHLAGTLGPLLADERKTVRVAAAVYLLADDTLRQGRDLGAMHGPQPPQVTRALGQPRQALRFYQSLFRIEREVEQLAGDERQRKSRRVLAVFLPLAARKAATGAARLRDPQGDPPASE